MPVGAVTRRLPISLRLAAMTTAAFMALLAAVGAVAHQRLGTTLRNGIDQQLVDIATALAAHHRETGELDVMPGSDGDPAVDEELAGVEPSDRDVQQLDAAGEVVDASEDLQNQQALIELDELPRVPDEAVLRTLPEPGDSDGDELRVLARPLDRDDGFVIVALELDSVEEAQAALLKLYAPTALVASVLAGGLGYLIARRGLAPIDRLTAEAAVLGTGDARGRLSDPGREDEVGRLARTLNGMLDRLEAAVDRERAFTADASHELRTPLAILRAEVELAAGHSRDAEVEASLRSALEEADRLGVLIDDLLALARAESAGIGRDHVVDVAAVADSVVARFGVLAATRGVDLRRAGAGSLTLVGDGPSVERAVGNLVDNAVRHTPAGGSVEVEVQAVAGGGARVSVADTGPGLGGGDVDRVLDRFARAAVREPAADAGGAGLGLAIVAAVAAAHGGSATVANRDGGGLRATLELRTGG
jgi:signal transduction histidine kinase